MTSIHNDNRVPLPVRLALANAALAYAAALVDGSAYQNDKAREALNDAVEDCNICLRAAELGME